MSEHREAAVQLESRFGRPGAAVLERLRMARARRGSLSCPEYKVTAVALERAH